MRWQFWQQPVPQKLSEHLKKALLSEFPLDPQLAERIRYMGKKGRYAGRPSEYIRIFDPTLIVVSAGTAAPTYEGLSEAHNHRRALLFDGRTEKIDDTERVFLTDRRTA